MVAIDAVPLKSTDDAETIPFNNKVDLAQASEWLSLGGRSGILEGWAVAVVAGQMQVTVAVGSGMCAQRDAAQVEQRWGYVAQTRATSTVQFNAAGGANRRDALVFAIADPTAPGTFPGSLGLAAGGHLIAIPGTSPTVDLTDAQIQAAVGPGGFHRIANVLIPTGATQVTAGNIAYSQFKIGEWNLFTWIPGFTLNSASGWSVPQASARYKMNSLRKQVEVRLTATRTGADTATCDSAGNWSPDMDITTNWPSILDPLEDQFLMADRDNGGGSASGVTSFRVRITVASSRLQATNSFTGTGVNISNGATITITGIYNRD